MVFLWVKGWFFHVLFLEAGLFLVGESYGRFCLCMFVGVGSWRTVGMGSMGIGMSTERISLFLLLHYPVSKATFPYRHTTLNITPFRVKTKQNLTIKALQLIRIGFGGLALEHIRSNKVPGRLSNPLIPHRQIIPSFGIALTRTLNTLIFPYFLHNRFKVSGNFNIMMGSIFLQ